MSSYDVLVMLSITLALFAMGFITPVIVFLPRGKKTCTYDAFTSRKASIDMSLSLLFVVYFLFFVGFPREISETWWWFLRFCVAFFPYAALWLGLRLGYMTAFFNDLDRWTKPKR